MAACEPKCDCIPNLRVVGHYMLREQHWFEGILHPYVWPPKHEIARPIHGGRDRGRSRIRNANALYRRNNNPTDLCLRIRKKYAPMRAGMERYNRPYLRLIRKTPFQPMLIKDFKKAIHIKPWGNLRMPMTNGI